MGKASVREIALTFFKLGMTAFGGPAMIPYIRAEAVEKKQWLSEEAFSAGMAVSQIIPGATAMQMAAYVGLIARDFWGAIAAYTAFALPAFIMIVAISCIYVDYGNVGWMLSLFEGFKVVVVAMVARAACRFAVLYCKDVISVALACLSFVWLLIGLDPVTILLGVCLLSIIVLKGKSNQACGQVVDKPGYILLWICVLVGILGFVLLLLRGTVWHELGFATAKIDLFAFGGGYVSVPLMYHEVVAARGWLSSGQFIDGIALGQITPGPIVMTAAFVGYLVKGLSGALVATVYVFAPSFILICLATVFMKRLLGMKAFRKALAGSLLSLVGLLAAVGVKFAMTMEWTWFSTTLFVCAFVALFRYSIFYVVAAGAGLSILAWYGEMV